MIISGAFGSVVVRAPLRSCTAIAPPRSAPLSLCMQPRDFDPDSSCCCCTWWRHQSLLTYAASQCSKGALCMQSGCQNWRLATICVALVGDFSHDLTAICMEIKVEAAATKAHGNVSATTGFMAPAASVLPRLQQNVGVAFGLAY